MSEEEVQKQFELGNPQGKDRDTIAYREVFRVITKEPVLKISHDLAGSVVRKVIAKKKREAKRDMIWLSFGVVFLLVGLIVTAAVAGLQFELGFLKDMSGILIFGAVMILAFNWLERKMLFKKV